MYTGTYTQLIDAKGRIFLPGAFRQEFGSSFTLSLGFDGCLELWRPDDWHAFVERELQARSALSKDARAVTRLLLNNAYQGEFDSQFRFTVPQYLRSQVKLEREIVLAGSGRKLEIWPKRSWDEYQTRISGNIEDIAESLAKDFRL